LRNIQKSQILWTFVEAYAGSIFSRIHPSPWNNGMYALKSCAQEVARQNNERSMQRADTLQNPHIERGELTHLG